MSSSIPASIKSSDISWKQRESHAPADQSSVYIWLDGLERQSALLKYPTTSCLTRSRAPLQSTQAKLTPSLCPITSESVSGQKRKRLMDEDDNENHNLEPRRSDRINAIRNTARRPQEDDQNHSGAQTGLRTRRRGRPLKNASTTAPPPVLGSPDDTEANASENTDIILPLRNDLTILGNTEIPDLPPPLSPARTGTTRTSSRSSPSRVKGIKRENLVNLSPTIKFETVAEGKKHWPSHIQSLWRDRVSSLVHETKVVPPRLKDRMRQLLDTPAKSRPPPDDNNLALTDRYTVEDLAFVWTTVCRVVKKAGAQRTKNGPESQWCSFMVAPILDLLHQLHCYTDGESQLEILNISTTSIDPIALCPYHENPEVWRILNKKIDFAIGLNIPYEQKSALQNGIYRYPHPQKPGTSINQTSSWVNYVPMFLNIEVKKKNVSDDPMIQIGVWVASEFRKRELEGYDISMPVFAIEIEEDMWNLYIGYASSSTSNHVVFMGPESMGDTKSHQGVFKIIHVLNGLAEWGNTEYRAWFEREILVKYQTC